MFHIGQRQVQKMLQKLSPQQIQMIKLLELPAIQLEQRIKQEIEENPVLEEDNTENKEENELKEISVEDYFTDDDTPCYKYNINNFSKDVDKRPIYLSEGKTFHESLVEQLGFKQLNERESVLAKYIIGSIDDDGYLRRTLQSMSDDVAFSLGIEVSEEELEKVLKTVQELEPTGVGARNLQECLLLQLEAIPYLTHAQRTAHTILTDFFDDFTKKHYEKLMTRLGIDYDEFRDSIEAITSLLPKPGHTYSGGSYDNMPYIIPDFTLEYQNGMFDLRLNANVPDLKINKRYVDMIREIAIKDGNITDEADKEAVQFVKNKIDSAKWFILAIQQRHDTMFRTMQAILDYQREYFADGDQANLRPMILKDIAGMTGLDVSTISRVVNSKYIQTYFGIIPLKQLFSEAMQTDSGEEVSSYEIKKMLTECIEQEDKRKPLTDEILMETLNNKGYHIARRTVAKYREILGIPVARMRKEF